MRRILSPSACQSGLWNGLQNLSPRDSMVSEILNCSNWDAVNRPSSAITGFPVSELTTQPWYGPERGTL